MRIVVDSRSLLPIGPGLGPTGVGRWTANVIRALAEQAPDWELVLAVITRDPVDIDLESWPKNVSLHVIRLPERWFRRALVFGIAPRVERFLGRFDVMLGAGFETWPGRFSKIPVIHDLAFLTHPESVSPRNLAYLRLMIPRIIRGAAGIVTVSSSVKGEIVERLGVSAASVFVVPNGCTIDTAAAENLPDGLLPGYLLFVGTFEPRKNLERVLAAYRSLRSERGELPELVVVGGRGWRGADELRRRAEDTPGVVVLGYVDDAVLDGLYRDARMLVFPSLYEGFGLPVIEAMAAGTPVVTSRVGALEEVADGAAVLVDPTDPGDIARGIATLLDDADLARRLGDAGKKVASGYSWERAGAALRDAIEALAAPR